MKKKILLLLILLSLLIETPKRIDATSSIITTISGPSTGIVNQPLTYNLTITSTYTIYGTDFSASWVDGYVDIDGTLVPNRFTQDMLFRRPSTLCTYNSDYSIANCAVTFTPTLVTMYRLGVSANDGASYCSFTNRDICPFGGIGSYLNIGSCGPSSCQLLNVSNPQLTVNKTGLGTVTSNPPGINCGTTCNYTYNYGDVVTLTATAATGYTFSSWSGCSTSTSSTITVTMDANKSCTATFIQVEAPTISSLQIGNNSLLVAGFTSTLKASGLQSTQGGKGWYNPMVITLNATAGTGTITDYYVAFYDKTLTQAATAATFLSDITANFNSGTKAKNGFLLGYSATSAKYYVWDYSATTSTVGASNCNTNGCFVEIGTSRQICGKNTSGNLDCTNKLYYTVYPVSAASWMLRLDKNFGSKTMYTATYVTDSNNLVGFNANINPAYP